MSANASFVVEDRKQSHGTEITSHRDDLLAVQVLAQRAPTPTDLAVRLMILRLQGRGLSVGVWEAEALVQEILTAEKYAKERPPHQVAVDPRD